MARRLLAAEVDRCCRPRRNRGEMMPDLRKEAARVEPKMISFHGDDDRSRGEGWKLVIQTRRTRGDGGDQREERRGSRC